MKNRKSGRFILASVFLIGTGCSYGALANDWAARWRVCAQEGESADDMPKYGKFFFEKTMDDKTMEIYKLRIVENGVMWYSKDGWSAANFVLKPASGNYDDFKLHPKSWNPNAGECAEDPDSYWFETKKFKPKKTTLRLYGHACLPNFEPDGSCAKGNDHTVVVYLRHSRSGDLKSKPHLLVTLCDETNPKEWDSKTESCIPSWMPGATPHPGHVHNDY